ncbi:MAG: hypothetical protein HC867_03625 [Bacteroidia bacterium]|nr:hypothetical protein [Bacteroidia bacterium]
MKIIIESPDLKISSSLEEFVINKVSKLKRLHQKIISAEVTLEMEVKKTKEMVKCSIILNIPGKDEYVKSSSEIFEDAILKAVVAAQRRLQIRKTQKIVNRKSVLKEKSK